LETVFDDHRVRVAQMRRDRMTKRLLASVKESYAGRPQEGVPTVDDVIKVAEVSRATFYKYFNSVEEAVGAIASDMVDDMVRSLIELHGSGRPAIFLLTSSIHLFLLRAVIDPSWAAFVARSDVLQSEGSLFRGISTHLLAARAAGEIAFDDLDAARTLAVGGMIEAIRNVALRKGAGRGFIEEVTVMIYIALGMTCDQARATLRDVTIFIRGAAPDLLPWWRDPWAPKHLP
jgi:AcrR family transcriptional regulator